MNALPAPRPNLSGRRVLALAPLLGFLAVSGSHWLELAKLWSETNTLGHGWLLLAVIGWELWRRRRQITNLALAPYLPAGLAMAGLAALWAIAWRLDVATIELTLLPVLLLAGLVTATSRRGFEAFAFPVLLALFATPIWFWLVPVLKNVAIVVVGTAVKAVGMTALIEGELITLPSGRLRIADSCSGVHQFVVAALIGTLYAWWNFEHHCARAKVILLACVTAVIANWIRVFALIAIGYATEMQHYFVRVDHYWFGWALFAVAITCYFFIARRMRDRPCIGAETGSR